MDKKEISKVLVLGDSFSELWPAPNKDPHWLIYLTEYFKWDVTNLSKSGSGISTAIHDLLNFNGDFDLCIALYSNPDRLFHPIVTDLNHGTALANLNIRNPTFKNYKEVYDSAASYYTYFTDVRLNSLRGIGLHEFIDDYIIEKYPDKKFIHFDCFPLHKEKEKNGVKETERIYYKFKHGLTMYPSLFYLSATDPYRPSDIKNENRHGHISTHQHIEVFNHLKNIIENNFYSDDKIYIYNNDFNDDEVIIGIDEFDRKN